MQTLMLDDNSWVYARAIETDINRSWSRITGHQYERFDGSTDRFVSLSFHGKRTAEDVGHYAAVYLSPDEARALAYRLLDEADTADENLDAPVDLVPTGKA